MLLLLNTDLDDVVGGVLVNTPGFDVAVVDLVVDEDVDEDVEGFEDFDVNLLRNPPLLLVLLDVDFDVLLDAGFEVLLEVDLLELLNEPLLNPDDVDLLVVVERDDELVERDVLECELVELFAITISGTPDTIKNTTSIADDKNRFIVIPSFIILIG